MIITYTAKDLLADQLVDPAFYLIEIEGAREEADKKATGTNCWIKGKIIRNDDTGDEKFKGVPTPYFWMFNSKAAWSTVGFMKALGVDVAEGKSIEMTDESLRGRKIVAFIGNGTYNDKAVNVIDGRYRKPKE